MNLRGSGKLLTAAGILCFAVAFLLLNSFRGEFGKDTAGLNNDAPWMEDTLEVTPQAAAPAQSGPERIASVAAVADKNIILHFSLFLSQILIYNLINYILNQEK